MKKFILLILCLFPATLFAQSATDYFHIAANHYVNAQKKVAQATIKEGIQKFPNNQKLKNLASKIEELPDPEEDQQNQDQQNQDNQNQQDQDQQQQQQDQKKDEMQQKQQQQQQQISREDAQRLLDAIAQEEKELQEKLKQKERAGARPKIEKNW
jgi:DNA anti-recombination protein RmuC